MYMISAWHRVGLSKWLTNMFHPGVANTALAPTLNPWPPDALDF